MIVNKPTNKKKKKISRYTVLSIIMIAIFSVIILKLLYIQVFNYDEYKDKADVTSTRFISEKAPRGKIYDDKGNVLATNIQTYTITYTETKDADKQFYITMKELFKILDENGESIQDSLPLKIDGNNNIYFEYKTNEKQSQNIEELRFKKDRGLNDTLKNKMFKDVEELSDEQNAKLDEELLKITPDDAFYALVKSYNLIGLVDPDYDSKEKKNVYSKMEGKDLTDMILKEGYSLNDIRKFMLVKDAIKMQSFKGYKSVTIAENIKKDTSLVVMQKKYDLPGINVSSAPIRSYPYNNLASSVLGYVSSINDTQKSAYELKGYDVSSDYVGKSGIESAFEEQLKGVKGGTTVKVNSKGSVSQELFKLEPYPGNDVHLTIDRDIQYAADQALADKIADMQATGRDDKGNRLLNATRGALVAVEVKTGRVLALTSYPNLNPNLFTVPGQLTPEQYQDYFNPDLEKFGQEFIKRMGINKTVDYLFPKLNNGTRWDKFDLYPKATFNYATQSLIPPGSTFKPLTAIAGLESGAISPGTIINDTGSFNTHPEIFGSAFNPGGLEAAQGPIGLTKAIAQSINFYFYETATQMYINAGGLSKNVEDKARALNSIANYAWQFGLGIDPNSNAKQSTGIEIGENFGQTYNFTSWRNTVLQMSTDNIINFLDSGNYNNTIYFTPINIRDKEDDNDEVRKSKKAIKDKVKDTINKDVDDPTAVGHDAFAKDIRKDVLNLMNNSDEYKASIAGRNINLDAQATSISQALAQFAANDQPGQVRSPGSLVSASIGQGMNNFTPLQLASYISTFANGGTRYKIHLVDKITDGDGNVVQEFKPEVLNTVKISKETQDAVKQGMTAVNQEADGTGSSTFLGYPIPTAGKTGTADVSDDQLEKGREPYATYVSFAPANDPQIAVAAVVFDGGHGSSIAPVVRAVYDAYFKDQLKNDTQYTSSSETWKKYVLGNPYNQEANASQANTNKTH
ncbi:penicillin-binding protein [Clostridium beijerinckii]|uniref:Penicillin-binding protein n=1 Tax=Clostridium beijerinckii TaxID=1520 RepID=A0AB74VH79_CLOBE|nr:penicillin-binding transpeptidase domain-containing protein [Clostridium beijerinckii]NRZ24969.1 penicillin-binding protein 2 [Clostridium beijerinckii]NYB99672.1 penicillin-binding protein 2 [Clostridium beijerinckii]OOM22871.1 penicillin-binding protein 2B [Clostridium beijerinckii]QUN35766.1 penicillin-binding protein [Clostridium beijerinckii]SQB13559.1 penicillin-binding protein, transpeptidase [Clostridium beijerinckii]